MYILKNTYIYIYKHILYIKYVVCNIHVHIIYVVDIHILNMYLNCICSLSYFHVDLL